MQNMPFKWPLHGTMQSGIPEHIVISQTQTLVPQIHPASAFWVSISESMQILLCYCPYPRNSTKRTARVPKVSRFFGVAAEDLAPFMPLARDLRSCFNGCCRDKPQMV